jgi:hypothetical protein
MLKQSLKIAKNLLYQNFSSWTGNRSLPRKLKQAICSEYNWDTLVTKLLQQVVGMPIMNPALKHILISHHLAQMDCHYI